MNTIALIGVNGKVGRFLVKEALEKKYKVKVLIRDSKSLKYFMHYLHENVEIIVGDAHSKEDIKNLVKGCNAVINTVGHFENCEGFYSNITNNIIDIMKDFNINRYISIASGALRIDSDERGFFHNVIAKFMYSKYGMKMADKEKALSLLKKSELNWSVYRLPKVIENQGIKKIKIDYNVMKGYKISNRTIAEFLIDQIDNEEHFGKLPFIWE